MAKNEAQKQKKLAKKKSKELAKKREAAREKNYMASFAGQFDTACGGEILLCVLGDSFDQSNIGMVTVVRRGGSGNAVWINYLVDTALLGVKDVVTQTIPMPALEDLREQMLARGSAATPATAKRLIDDSIAFAKQHGVAPHSDYQRVIGFLDDVDSSQAKRTYEMGINGKPTFIPGPYDTPDKVAEMAQQFSSRGIKVDMLAVADSMLGDGDYEALDDPELDVDIDEDVIDAPSYAVKH